MSEYFQGIDLSSDTATRPSKEMRQIMFEAEVGDEQRGEDPSTNVLERKAAEILGKEAAIFLPSATMANEIAIQLSCSMGDALICAANSHILNFEVGGPAAHSRATCFPIPQGNGIYDVADFEPWVRSGLPHLPQVTFLAVENTTNGGGGIPWPPEQLARVALRAKELDLATHMDGARLMNASVACDLSPAKLSAPFDTVTLCLSKGLGAPMGAILALPQKWENKARRFKHLMGGALRQSGIVAAAGLFALENNVARLAEDHANAQALRTGLQKISGINVEECSSMTNMVFFTVTEDKMSPDDFLSAITQKGLRFVLLPDNRFRAVTHLGVAPEDIDRSLEIVRSALS